MGNQTTIPLSKETRLRLKALGSKGTTYDYIINALIDNLEKGEDGTTGSDKRN